MRDSGCGCAPVVENTKTLKLVGVVTERDVCCSVAADDRPASDVRVKEIMRPSSACSGVDQPVEEARLARRACPLWTRREVAAAPSAAAR
jgi:CBS domain-containing protein